MVNNGQKPIAPYLTRLVGEVRELVCISCHKTHDPCKREISTKNPNIYYKSCYDCRLRNKEYHREYRQRMNYLG